MQKIGGQFDSFSPKHRVLAKFIIDNHLNLAYSTVAEFAHGAHVSETTVVRFVYFLGFSNFADFMGELREEIEKAKSVPSVSMGKYSFDKGDIDFRANVMRAIFSLETAVMEETLSKNPTELFDEAVNRLDAASMIIIVGCTANKCHTQAAYFALDVLKPNVKVIEEYGLPMKSILESVPKNAVCLAFSTPRYPRETQAILKDLRDCPDRPFVIGITDSMLSPLSAESDLVLQIPEKYVMYIDTNAAYMALIHALAFGIYLKNPSDYKKRIDEYDAFVKKGKLYVRDFIDLIDFGL